MQYAEFKPHQSISRYVECYWYAYSDKPPFRERESLIPDGTIELMFNFGDSYAQIRGDTKELIKGSHIIGIRKQSLTISQTSKQHFFSIRFRPGGHYPFFGLPVHHFANGFYSLHDIFGKELDELEEQLAEAKTNQRRIAIADQFLLKRIDVDSEDLRFVARCLPDLLRGGDVMATAHAFNTNYKAL